MSECKACHNAYERLRRSKKRSMRADLEIAKFMARLKKQRSHRQIEMLCSLVCSEFGGLENFAAAWVDYFRRATARGGATGLKCFQALMKLLQYLDQQRSSPIELGDEDLEHELMAAAEKLIVRNPELAVDAARQLGWVVIPA